MRSQNLQEEIQALRLEVGALSSRLDELDKHILSSDMSTNVDPALAKVPRRIVRVTADELERHRQRTKKRSPWHIQEQILSYEQRLQSTKSSANCSVAGPVTSPYAQSPADQPASHAGLDNGFIKHAEVNAPPDPLADASSSKLDNNNFAPPDVELQIGKYWLNRIGIGSLVLGVVFLILYSFQYFGIIAKLSVGYLFSASLILIGEKISRQTNRDWYGNTLIGGGWSLAYFTAYAMHFIPELKVLDSFSLELVALCSVTAGAMTHAVHKNSEPLALIATLFGIISIALGPQSHLSYLGYLAISAGAAFIAVSNNWTKAFYVAMLSTYAAHMYATGALAIGVSSSGGELANSIWSVVSLFAYWSMFNASLTYFADAAVARRNHSLVLAWLNALYLTSALFGCSHGPLAEYRYWFFAGAAICYLLSDRFLAERKLVALSETHTFFGLMLLNIAFGIKLEQYTLCATYLGEVAVLCSLHLRDRRQIYGWYAPLLLTAVTFQWLTTTCSLPYISSIWIGLKSVPQLCTGLLGVVVCAGVSRKYKHSIDSVDSNKISIPAGLCMYEVYAVFGIVFAAALPILVDSKQVQMMYWSTLACLNAAIFLRTRLNIFNLAAQSLLFFASLVSAIEISKGLTPICFAVTALYIAFDCLTVKAHSKSSYAESRIFAHAANLLMLFMVFQAPTQLISLGFAALGLSTLIIGFRWATKVYRGWGLVSLGLLSCRLVTVDLAHVNTVERILSFTVAGAILLIGSFAYTKFAERKQQRTGIGN